MIASERSNGGVLDAIISERGSGRLARYSDVGRGQRRQAGAEGGLQTDNAPPGWCRRWSQLMQRSRRFRPSVRRLARRALHPVRRARSHKCSDLRESVRRAICYESKFDQRAAKAQGTILDWHRA